MFHWQCNAAMRKQYFVVAIKNAQRNHPPVLYEITYTLKPLATFAIILFTVWTLA
ncbi:MAG: hypothetical protein WHV26_11595 [Spirochaetota bacterium]